jgi:hypothetical protein
MFSRNYPHDAGVGPGDVAPLLDHGVRTGSRPGSPPLPPRGLRGSAGRERQHPPDGRGRLLRLRARERRAHRPLRSAGRRDRPRQQPESAAHVRDHAPGPAELLRHRSRHR